MEERGNTRTGTTNNNPVSKPFTNDWGSDYLARTNRGKSRMSYYINGTRHQSTAIYKKGRSSPRIPRIRQSIQRRRIEALSSQTRMGSCHRIQEGCPGSNRLQGISHESN